MQSISTSRHPLILLTFLFLLGGCGLSRYQDGMDEQRKRVAKFDEVNLALDAPIAMPLFQPASTKADKPDPQPAWQYDVFLRLPKGYGTTIKDKTQPHSRAFPLVQYTGGEVGMNVFVVAALVQEKGADEPNKHLYRTDSFRALLRTALESILLKEHGTFVSLSPKVAWSDRSIRQLLPYPENAAMIRYQAVEYPKLGVSAQKSPPFALDVSICVEEGKQIAIVFQRAQESDADKFSRTVEACLGTLDMSTEVTTKRGAFKKAR